MIDAAYFIGAPKEFKKLCLIFPPTIKEVVANSKFGQLLQILTVTQEDLEDEFHDKLSDTEKVPTPFEFLLANCYHNKDFEELARDAFLLFTKQKVSFLYEQKIIVFGDLEQLLADKISIESWNCLFEKDYFDFQNEIRRSCGNKIVDPPTPEDPTEDPRIRKMKAKARYRDRIKAKKGTTNGISLVTCIIAVCCMGIGVTPVTIGEMSYAALNALMAMYQEKEKYDIDIRTVLAGADPKKVKPKYWIRNLKD